MRTARRLRLGITVSLLLVAVVGIVSISSTRGFMRASERVRQSDAMLLAVDQVTYQLAETESAVRGYTLTGDTAYLAPLNRAPASITAAVETMTAVSTSDSAQHAMVTRVAGLAQRKLDRLDQLQVVRRTQGFEAAAALLRSGHAKAVMDTLRYVAMQLADSARTTLREQEVQSVYSARATNTIVGIGAAFALVLLSLAAFLMTREFSVRRGAETALRESQAQLTQFLDSLPIGAVVVDCNGQATLANTTALSMFGAASLGELSQRTHQTLMPLWRESDHQPVPSADDPMRAALRGLAAQREGLELHVGETRIPIEISAAPVFDSNGNVAFAIATFSDVTERQRARVAMELARQAAEDSNRAKSEFLARMSHELRTPLNSVIGFANILLKNKAGNLREQDENYLQRILENGKHLLVLINDILDLSKVESGKVQVEWEPVDLSVILRQTVEQLEPQAKPGVMLSANVAPDLDAITSDSARLRQILINLIGNALKFTQGGHVTISVDVEPGTKRPARIRVTDSGIGIPPDRLNAIFDAFEQAEATTTRQFGGTGLGLPISRALCELLGYTLTVNSELGAGTEFCIDLLAEEKRRSTGGAGAHEVIPRESAVVHVGGASSDVAY